MYNASSLSPLSLSLSEVLVSYSSLSLPAKQLPSDSIPSCNMYFSTNSENCCRRHVCGGSDGCGGAVWWLQAGEEKRLHIGNDSQDMSQGSDYKDLLKSNLNKADLIRQLKKFVKRKVSRLHLDYILVITLEKEAWEKSLTGVQNLSPCNHKEADTRIMYHCSLEDKPAAVIASDTDILILVVNAFASCLPKYDWFLQTKKNQSVNVSKFHDYTDNAVAITFTAMFVITGCYTVSYFYVSPRRL